MESGLNRFDHASVGQHVECAYISDVKEFIKNGKLDVAMCCQSSMGTNWGIISNKPAEY
jgi:hypothetical protein